MAYNPDFTGRLPKDTYASILNTDGISVFNSTGSQLYFFNLTSSWSQTASISITSSWATTSSFALTYIKELNTGSTYVITSSWAISASWAPSQSVGTTLFTGSTYPITSSWSNNVISSSYSVSSSLSVTSSYARTSSFNLSSSYAFSSSWAISASWAPSLVETWPVSITQSFFDIPLKDMIVVNSGGLSQIDTSNSATQLISDVRNSIPYVPFYYIRMPSYDELAGSNHPWKYTSYQLKLPFNFSNGLTYSFQYFEPCFGGILGGVGSGTKSNKSYWEIRLFSITSSIQTGSNFWNPVLVSNQKYTWSMNTVNTPPNSGSIFSTSSYLSDPSGFLTRDSLVILNLYRVSSLEVSTTGGDGTDYTASLGLLSSQFKWNVR